MSAIELSQLARFQPLNALNPDNLEEIHKQVKLESISAGKFLFKNLNQVKRHII